MRFKLRQKCHRDGGQRDKRERKTETENGTGKKEIHRREMNKAETENGTGKK